MHRSARTLTAIAAAAVLTAAAAAPAGAARWSHDDAVGDVLTTTSEAGTEEPGEPAPSPEATHTDVTRLTVQHQPRRLALQVDLVDLTGSSGLLVYDLRTDHGDFGVMQKLGRGRGIPAVTLSRRRSPRPVPCAGLEHTADREADRATLSIPRRCLGQPTWVRVGAGAVSLELTETGGSQSADDALRDAVVRDRLRFSPPVARG